MYAIGVDWKRKKKAYSPRNDNINNGEFKNSEVVRRKSSKSFTVTPPRCNVSTACCKQC